MSVLRVLTSNLRCAGSDDLERIASAIHGFDADIVALQEVDLVRARSLGDALGLIGEHDARSRVATLTRLAIEGAHGEPGRPLVTWVRWGHDELAILNNGHRVPRAHVPARVGPGVVALDQVIIRGAVRVLRSGLWRGPGVRRASDHAPVFAELERAISSAEIPAESR